MSLIPNGHRSGMFIRANPVSVADCLVSWGSEYPVNRFTTARRELMPLERAWESLEERHFQPDRGLLIPLPQNWTGFFDNHRDEFLAQAELYVLCKRLQTETCFFSYDHRDDSPN